MENNKFTKACKTALLDCMGLQKDETLLVISDCNKREIGITLFEVGKANSKESLYVEITPRQINGEEPPVQIAELMKKVDCVLCPTTKSLTHTNARREAAALGVRIGTMPGISKEILVRCLNADYNKIIELSNKVNKILSTGDEIKIKTELGTSFSFKYTGRKIISSTGVLRNKGESGNLPSGEVYLAPLEGTSNGIIVVDGSMAGIGLLKDPIILEIKEGYITYIEGKKEAKQFKSLLEKNGKEAFAVAEFGVGTNYKAKISGQILEDEKVYGTIHIAFGNNISMGGIINVASHYDGLIIKPDVFMDNNLIMKKGKLL